jgi:predicted PurR-regulated permease PerM
VASVGASWLSAFLRSLWSDGRMLLSLFSLLVVTPIITAYLVYDWKRFVGTVDQLVPVADRNTVRALAREVDATVANVLRGQGTICLILVVFYGVALRAIGLEHGLLIGLVSGLLSLIPYFGSLTGLMLSLVLALVQFGLIWTPILIIIGIFLVGQSLADYVLAPYLVGSKVHLNPVWLMFALFSFGYLFGFVGLLIAVPLAASIGVLVRFALRQNSTAVPRGSAAAGLAPPVDGENPLLRPPLQ